MVLYIACDHGGIELKNAIVEKLKKCKAQSIDVVDYGTNTADSVDYPDYGYKVAESVAADTGSKGIVICKTGVGMSICANKVKGVRCALCTSVDMARLCREHNNANVLALGAGNTDIATALDMVDAFLSTEFAGGRHEARVNKIMAHEDSNG